MSPVEFEPTISAGEWPQTYALDRVATGSGNNNNNNNNKAADLIEDKSPYYKYTPASVLENDNFKLYWNRNILTEKNNTV